MSYTTIELACLKAKRELEAAQELTALTRAELHFIAQLFHLSIKRNADHIDLVTSILNHTHPKPTPTPTPAPTPDAQQMRIF